MRIQCLLLLALSVRCVHAETGHEAWLRYAPTSPPPSLPAVVATLRDSPMLHSAREEWIKGIRGMLNKTPRIATGLPTEGAVVFGTLADLHLTANLAPDAYWLKSTRQYLYVTASSDRGVLYGTFALLNKIAEGQPISGLDERHTPSAPLRWVNQWDNLDGSIKRGYGGRSIFWE